jgi:hypothetical protein
VSFPFRHRVAPKTFSERHFVNMSKIPEPQMGVAAGSRSAGPSRLLTQINAQTLRSAMVATSDRAQGNLQDATRRALICSSESSGRGWRICPGPTFVANVRTPEAKQEPGWAAAQIGSCGAKDKPEKLPEGAGVVSHRSGLSIRGSRTRLAMPQQRPRTSVGGQVCHL